VSDSPRSEAFDFDRVTTYLGWENLPIDTYHLLEPECLADFSTRSVFPAKLDAGFIDYDTIGCVYIERIDHRCWIVSSQTPVADLA